MITYDEIKINGEPVHFVKMTYDCGGPEPVSCGDTFCHVQFDAHWTEADIRAFRRLLNPHRLPKRLRK